ncbi:LacI family DNA-binding transcriptional regulator [Streptomyces sp. NPDC048514]|uniref:LacI family DNA-binding transcriptional regulator n=1 Tax=Streptomyces sp. NPDC048514 TaxID=3365564 RepID=UPI00371109B3
MAREARVSTAVVSYVMNDGPRPVAPATRERVLAAAAALGYQPNRIARALRARTTGVVGLILAEAPNPYFSALGRHIEQALSRREKLTLIGNAGFSADRQESLVDRFLAAQVDGLVIVSADGGTDVAAAAEAAGVPAVYVHHQPAAANTPFVAADNRASVEVAIAHLRQHGHDHIAFLAGPDDRGPVRQRTEAWQGIVGSTESRLLRCEYTRAAAARMTRDLIAGGAMPAALITATDEQAVGVLAGAWGTGLSIPEQLAVISLDGTPDSAHTAPSLTVTQQPLQAMAQQAVDSLLDAAAPGEPVRATLVTRRSCGCADTTY